MILFLLAEKDSLKFLEVKHAIACFVMLNDHVVDFLTIDFFAELLHGKADVLFRDLS